MNTTLTIKDVHYEVSKLIVELKSKDTDPEGHLTEAIKYLQEAGYRLGMIEEDFNDL